MAFATNVRQAPGRNRDAEFAQNEAGIIVGLLHAGVHALEARIQLGHLRKAAIIPLEDVDSSVSKKLSTVLTPLSCLTKILHFECAAFKGTGTLSTYLPRRSTPHHRLDVAEGVATRRGLDDKVSALIHAT